MTNRLKQVFASIAVATLLTGVSCQQAPAPAATPAAAQPQRTDNGRYLIVVGNEGTAGTVLFLLDSRDGGTWIYRPPTPGTPAFNGFWSDIPPDHLPAGNLAASFLNDDATSPASSAGCPTGDSGCGAGSLR